MAGTTFRDLNKSATINGVLLRAFVDPRKRVWLFERRRSTLSDTRSQVSRVPTVRGGRDYYYYEFPVFGPVAPGTRTDNPTNAPYLRFAKTAGAALKIRGF